MKTKLIISLILSLLIYSCSEKSPNKPQNEFSIQGKVTYLDGFGIAEAEVIIYKDVDVLAATTTDNDGNFTVTGLENGTYALEALKQNHSADTASVVIDQCDEQVDFTIKIMTLVPIEMYEHSEHVSTLIRYPDLHIGNDYNLIAKIATKVKRIAGTGWFNKFALFPILLDIEWSVYEPGQAVYTHNVTDAFFTIPESEMKWEYMNISLPIQDFVDAKNGIAMMPGWLVDFKENLKVTYN